MSTNTSTTSCASTLGAVHNTSSAVHSAPPSLPAPNAQMSLMNVAEDLSGLSRADLVYKAKLAEQAER